MQLQENELFFTPTRRPRRRGEIRRLSESRNRISKSMVLMKSCSRSKHKKLLEDYRQHPEIMQMQHWHREMQHLHREIGEVSTSQHEDQLGEIRRKTIEVRKLPKESHEQRVHHHSSP